MGEDGTEYVELRFAPRWTYVNAVRKFVASFFLIGLADQERAEQISMAASELLENAVKFATEETLSLSIRRNDHSVDVCVTNRADAERLGALRKEIALATVGDPAKLYLAKLRETSKASGSGGLGLVRIVHEAGARLRLETDGDRVSVHALFSLEAS